jgi:hypothetical protein
VSFAVAQSNFGHADENGVANVLHVLQEGITATRKHPGDDPRMRLEGFLADFVSTRNNDKGWMD